MVGITSILTGLIACEFIIWYRYLDAADKKRDSQVAPQPAGDDVPVANKKPFLNWVAFLMLLVIEGTSYGLAYFH